MHASCLVCTQTQIRTIRGPLPPDERQHLHTSVMQHRKGTSDERVSCVAVQACTLAYTGPHEILLPLMEYDLTSLQAAINASLLKNNHVTKTGGSIPSATPVFSFAGDRASGLPPGWDVRAYDPHSSRDPSDPVPPFSGKRTGRQKFNVLFQNILFLLPENILMGYCLGVVLVCSLIPGQELLQT